jgi:hypothetical protein
MGEASPRTTTANNRPKKTHEGGITRLAHSKALIEQRVASLCRKMVLLDTSKGDMHVKLQILERLVQVWPNAFHPQGVPGLSDSPNCLHQ